MLHDLNIKLTGGRLTAVTKQAATLAYEAEVTADAGFTAAMQVMVMSPEFNTLGSPKPFTGEREKKTQKNNGKSDEYKAVVLLFLSGGADTWNLMVPHGSNQRYEDYSTIRGSLSLQVGEMIELKGSTTGDSANYAVHKSFNWLGGTLFNKDKKAAFFSNIGNLADPFVSKADYESSSVSGKKRPFGLMSHADQTKGAHTLKCQDMGVAARGAGGRLADVLAKHYNKVVRTYSFAGNAAWPQGVDTTRDILDNEGSRSFQQYEALRDTIRNLTSQRHHNVYAEQYAVAFEETMVSVEQLGAAMEGVKVKTSEVWKEETGLHKQFQQVSKLIQTANARKVNRELFYVQVGGWDHHTSMKANTMAQFRDMDAAFRRFHDEMKTLGVWNDVTVMTHSEFGRTLSPNGNAGSDHAWAGQHLMFGGSVNGGNIYNKYPDDMSADNSKDLGRGRLIPQFPWESMMVPIAKWMGVTDGDTLRLLFPNLDRFNSTQLNEGVSIFNR